METFRLLKTRLDKASSQLPNLARALTLAFRATRGWTLSWGALLLVQGLLPVATVYLTRWLVNNLILALGSHAGWFGLRPVLVPMGLMVAVLLLSEALRSVTGWVRTAQAELLKDHIGGLVHAKSLELDLAFYDLPEFYDHLHRARDEASYRPVELLESVGSVLQNGVTLLAMGAVLIPYGVWVPLAVVVSTLPALYVVIRHTLLQHQWRLAATADERRTWYYDWLLTSRENAAEMRLFALGPRFQSAYQMLRDTLRGERVRIAREQGQAELLAGSFGLVVTGLAVVWMLRRTVAGLVSVGDLALFYQAFNQGQQLMRSLLQNVGHLYSNSLFLGNLFEFLALQPRVVSPPNPAPAPTPLMEGIRFEQVTFRYPGSERAVLRDFSLAIPADKLVAIVGLNGAGKTTLVKLLCRFYDPEVGVIRLDGVDLRAADPDELRRRMSVLFQEPVHYNATAGENIALGDAGAENAPSLVEAAARKAEAQDIVERLPLGYENPLGKWFVNGAELSTGEWQRIALARALMRRAPILVLDEPTSAMDPWSEVRWLGQLRNAIAGQTVLLITHRLTTAMRADVIHVMDAGRVVESGSHAELLAHGGRYAALWAEQRGGR
ncbi:MAG: ABC transporter ATP-binding protein [Candidatus Binatia bacterium]